MSSSGTATFSSAVMVGMRWNDWNTMPTLRPRNRASASSSRAPSAWSATTTEPESGRSRPAITISSVDLPEPDGPTMPTASPRPILRSMSLRIWTRAAPRPSDRLTPASAIAGVARCKAEVSFMSCFRRLLDGMRSLRSRSYRVPATMVQSAVLAAAVSAFLGLFLTGITQAADTPIKIVALGDSLTAGHNLPGSAAFPVKLERALRAKGHLVEVVNAGVSGDTASGGLARLDWSVPDGTADVNVTLGAKDTFRGLDYRSAHPTHHM